MFKNYIANDTYEAKQAFKYFKYALYMTLNVENTWQMAQALNKEMETL